MSVIVTDHAIERAGTRLGLNAKALRRTAPKAFEKGIQHKDTTGSLHRFLSALFLSHETASNLRIYGEHIWLFRRNILITVLHLPNEHKRAVQKLRKAAP